MKICSRCKQNKDLSSFGKHQKSKDGLMAACKSCRRAYDNNTYQTNPERKKSIRQQMKARSISLKIFVRGYLECHPCIDCGQTDADLLEFDHVRAEKVDGIGNMIRSACSMTRLLDEIAKCEVRCLYCHRKRTIKQFGWYSWLDKAPLV